MESSVRGIPTISMNAANDDHERMRRLCQAARSILVGRQFQGNSAARSLIL